LGEGFENLFEELARVALLIARRQSASLVIILLSGLEFVTKQAAARGYGNGGATVTTGACCPTRTEKHTRL